MARFLSAMFCVSLLLTDNLSATTRSYYLGLADNPHDNTIQAVLDTWGYIANDADMVIHHDDREGVPWTEAFWGLP